MGVCAGNVVSRLWETAGLRTGLPRRRAGTTVMAPAGGPEGTHLPITAVRSAIVTKALRTSRSDQLLQDHDLPS